MQSSAIRLDVVYERPFVRPMFQVSRSAVEIIECFYTTLTSEFLIAMSDLTVAHAQSMADIAIRTSLFGGNGLLELNVEKFTARFEGLRTKDDSDVAKNVILLSEAAMEKALPEAQYKGALIRTSAWMACDGGERAVQNLLNKYGTPKLAVSPSKFGADNVKPLIHTEYTNEREGWHVKLFMDLSELAGAHLYVLCNGTYTEDGKFVTFEERANHLENIYKDLFKHYDLETVAKLIKE